MQYVRFGATGLKVHPLCFGTMTLGGGADEKTSLELLDLAVDSGVNFFDSANVYNRGASETIIGKWMAARGHRDRIILSSKVRYRMGDDADSEGLSPRTIERELHGSLKRLNTDYLDIYFLHQPDYDTPLEVTWQCLDRLAREGKFRYVGLSNFAAWQIADAYHLARTSGWIRPTVVQCMYNLIARYPEHELFQACQALDMGVCNYNPLAGGLLTGKYGVKTEAKEGRLAGNEMYRNRYFDQRQRQAALDFAAVASVSDRSPVELAVRFCLDQSAIATVILGATRVQQLEQSLAAVDAPPLTEEETGQCDVIWSQLSGPIPLYSR